MPSFTFHPAPPAGTEFGVRPTLDDPVTSMPDEMTARTVAFVRGPLQVVRRDPGHREWAVVAES